MMFLKYNQLISNRLASVADFSAYLQLLRLVCLATDNYCFSTDSIALRGFNMMLKKGLNNLLKFNNLRYSPTKTNVG
jgi:hypothetical protein